MMFRLFALLCLTATPALSDEIWTSSQGEIAWWEDVGDVAIFRLAGAAGDTHFYIPDLPEQINARGLHEAYWIGGDAGDCGATLTGPDGMESTSWGNVTLAFDDKAFPTDFTLLIGLCMGDAIFSVRALSTAN